MLLNYKQHEKLFLDGSFKVFHKIVKEKYYSICLQYLPEIIKQTDNMSSLTELEALFQYLYFTIVDTEGEFTFTINVYYLDEVSELYMTKTLKVFAKPVIPKDRGQYSQLIPEIDVNEKSDLKYIKRMSQL